jgi:hypothetical protein
LRPRCQSRLRGGGRNRTTGQQKHRACSKEAKANGYGQRENPAKNLKVRKIARILTLLA